MRYFVSLLMTISVYFVSNENTIFAQSSETSEDCPQDLHLKLGAPAVLDQGKAPWCARFADIALLNYYKKKYAPAPDSANGEFCFSPTDFVRKETSWLGGRKNEIDLSRGKPEIGLAALQSDFKLQSITQVPFEFNHDSELVTLTEKIQEEAKRYFRDNPTAGEAVFGLKDTHWKATENGHGSLQSITVNRETFQVTGSVDENRYKSADNSSETELPPYKILHTSLNKNSFPDRHTVFQVLISHLKNDRPAVVDMCSERIEDIVNKHSYNPQSACSSHFMLAVAIKKVGGQCKVLLQNSWGANWNGNGRIELTFSDYLKMANSLDLNSIAPDSSGSQANLFFVGNAISGKGPVLNAKRLSDDRVLYQYNQVDRDSLSTSDSNRFDQSPSTHPLRSENPETADGTDKSNSSPATYQPSSLRTHSYMQGREDRELRRLRERQAGETPEEARERDERDLEEIQNSIRSLN